jgi:phytoene dehydrogenase-like protein
MSAGAALDQLRLALAGNVWYVDGGWQTLIDGLRDRALARGADVRSGARALSVRDEGGGLCVRLADGEVIRARTAVLAVGPAAVCELLGLATDAPLARWAAGRQPVKAACLDVALGRLPRPEHRFALGLDRPLYYSVHSASAKLAPEGVAVVHLMKYLGAEPYGQAEAVRQELEGLLDRLQPGWRDQVVARRFLPGLTVAHALPRADSGGLVGRPAVAVRERPHVYLAGDWVGREGMLADASAASAAEAARSVLAEPERTGARS